MENLENVISQSNAWLIKSRLLGWVPDHVTGYDDGVGFGVWGVSTRGGDGVKGWSWDDGIGTSGMNPTGIGVGGFSDSSMGVYGQSNSWIGVLGYSNSSTGVYGDSYYGTGVRGTGPKGVGVEGFSYTGYGIHGYSIENYGVNGSSTSGIGVGGYSDSYIGVDAYSKSSYGVRGQTNSGIGVDGYSDSYTGIRGWSNSGIGVHGYSKSSYGVYGYSGEAGYAAYLDGRVYIHGPLSKPGGSFKIDHPLDPANKYLHHSFVESPDMKNVYDGVVALDDKGEAEIELPDWFGVLNKDFRYQLTAIGAPGPNLYVAEEISDTTTKHGSDDYSGDSNNGNRFKIAGGTSGMKVSWQVTGIRMDPWANAHRFQVEEDKPDKERGYYIYPDLYGQPQEKGISHLLFPEEKLPRTKQLLSKP